MKKNFKFILIIFFSYFFINSVAFSETEKLKIGLLIPMTGKDKNLGDLIIKSTRMALEDIKTNDIEIIPKDTGSNPEKTLSSARELKNQGIKIVIGPIFYNSIEYLDELDDITFISLTNKTINLPKNVISSGINSTSQIKTIKKFIEKNEIKKTIFLTPKLDYEVEIKKSIKDSKIKLFKHFIYDTEPTKLTKQIEKITNYKIRKQNLADEIKRVEKSDLS